MNQIYLSDLHPGGKAYQYFCMTTFFLQLRLVHKSEEKKKKITILSNVSVLGREKGYPSLSPNTDIIPFLTMIN